MKRFFLFIMAVVISILAYAQPEHLTFKGVPIDGSLKQFVAKMVSSGFVHIESRDGTAVLTGDFAGYKDCLIGVSTPKNKDLVGNVTVIFSEGKSWSSLVRQYRLLKDMLTTKYGAPEDVIEEFQNGDPKDDFLRLQELKMDCCQYHTLFSLDKGDIVLTLLHDNMLGCRVALIYGDRINTMELDAAAMEDL